MSFSLFAQFAGGSGTEADPYQVATAEHLNNVRNYSGSRFIQTADIDLGVPPWNQGEGWLPIGSTTTNVSGYYNGNGFGINNLHINRPGSSSVGLFGVKQVRVSNLRLNNVYVVGYDQVGSLAGENRSSILNCSSSGLIIGYSTCGGLVGSNWSTISQSHNISTVNGTHGAGGLVGSNYQYSTIRNCYNTGAINGQYGAGGLVDFNRGYIIDSYNIGPVIGGGGLIGSSQAEYNGGYYSHSYWDLESSGQTTSAGGEARNSIEMIYPHSTSTYVEWDWQIWKPDVDHSVNDGYPYLRDPDEFATQIPEPAIFVAPGNNSQSVLTTTSLKWAPGFSYTNANAPTGYTLWLGTDNSPTNMINGLDIGYTISYDPIPDFEPNTTYYWKIVPYNAVGSALNCPIWSFTTYDNALTLSYPNGGEIWVAGTTRTIRWNSNSTPQINLSVSYDNGNNWTHLASIDGSKGFYHYQVPSINSMNCRMKLASVLDESITDISDGTFINTSSSSYPKVMLSYPSGGGINLKVGEPISINWSRQNVSIVSLDFSADDGQTWTEIASELSTDSCVWTLPDTPTLDGRIRVRSSDIADVNDISDSKFSISKIQLLTPNGGEIITGDYSGSYTYPITWSAVGMNNVKIQYSIDSGFNWVTAISSIKASYGIWYWTIPSCNVSNAMIRISNTSNNAIFDISDLPFNVRTPLKLVNANGGGFVTNYSQFNIRWRVQDLDPSSQIYWEYSSDNANWTRINSIAVLATDEAMNWYVVSSYGANLWLRAVESGSSRIVGRSDSSFRVADMELHLLEPNGGEDYSALSSQTIRWNEFSLTNLSIFYTIDDGATWTQVATNVPATTLTYSWIVPETPSVNCRIKLQDQTYPWMVLESDLPFTISPLQIIAPTVDFSADILEGDIPLAVQFTEDVNPGVGNVASRLWDFGDGNTSDQTNPLHTYTVAGTYTVSLTVTNDFEGTTTETKTDYITALPNTPRIELLSASSLNYGVVYLGDTSPTQIIVVKNIGTAPMIISSVSYYLANSQFALSGTELPISILVNETTQLSVVFVPTISGAVSDSIYIHSDASNIPSLAVKLSAVGEYVPPTAVDSLVVSVIGNDAHLTWQPVTTTIYGTPIEPDGYIVLYNETPYEDEHFYYFHSFVSGTNFVHPFVAQYRTEMFYRIVAVKNYREEALAYLMSLNGSRDRFTWGEIKEKLNTLKQRQ